MINKFGQLLITLLFFLMLGCGQGRSPASVSTIGDSAIESESVNPRICSASAQPLPGTDVSDYDPGTRWPTVAKQGLGFAFVKATEGLTLANPLFKSDWANAKAAGLVRGPYHFFHPASDPVKAANIFLATVGPLASDDLPAVLDWEVTDKVSSKTQIANALIWLNMVETATHKVPIIYTGPAFWNALGSTSNFARYPLFIANYGATCPQVPLPWKKWLFWQTGVGSISGLTSSQADKDLFNGSLSQLRTFALTGQF